MIIKTPSRLHVTLIDLNGIHGRIDGGIGITIQKPRLILEVEPIDDATEIIFEESNLKKALMNDYTKKIENATKRTMEFLKIQGGFKFIVKKTYPSHSGLGSGTQLSLAVGKAVSQIHEYQMSAPEIAKIVGRGGTSGIGVGAFDYGGFIIDGGHSIADKANFLPSSASDAPPPPIIARYDFPEDWKIIIVIPNVKRGSHGSDEINIFQKYCPIPLKDVQKLSHIVLMKMMPAVVERDINSFGFAIDNIQNIGFKKIEIELQNPIIKEIMENLKNAGTSGVGMSSFGPTVYAITDTDTNNIKKTAYDTIKEIGGKVIVTRAQNRGAIIDDRR